MKLVACPRCHGPVTLVSVEDDPTLVRGVDFRCERCSVGGTVILEGRKTPPRRPGPAPPPPPEGYDPTKIEQPEDLVADIARAGGCVCASLAVLPKREPSPCTLCRARAIMLGTPIGTVHESIARREKQLQKIDAKLAEWRARRKT